MKFIEPLWPIEAFKYNVENIFENYPTFREVSEIELLLLVAFANWMHILFKIINPRKNKGLSLQIITQLIEGPNHYYCTGSGQRDATINRVLIFETESGIEPFKRVRQKATASDVKAKKSDNKKKKYNDGSASVVLRCLHEAIEQYVTASSATISTEIKDSNGHQNIITQQSPDEFENGI